MRECPSNARVTLLRKSVFILLKRGTRYATRLTNKGGEVYEELRFFFSEPLTSFVFFVCFSGVGVSEELTWLPSWATSGFTLELPGADSSLSSWKSDKIDSLFAIENSSNTYRTPILVSVNGGIPSENRSKFRGGITQSRRA